MVSENKAQIVLLETNYLIKGISFSPDGLYAYVTDTGTNHGFQGYNYSDPSAM